jgi:hypothetical protein
MVFAPQREHVDTMTRHLLSLLLVHFTHPVWLPYTGRVASTAFGMVVNVVVDDRHRAVSG